MKRRRIRQPMPTPMAPAVREYYRNLKRYADAYSALVRAGLKDLIPALKETAADEIPEPRKASRSDAIGSYDIIYITRSVRLDANIEKKVSDLLADVSAALEDAFPNELLQNWAKAMIGKQVKGSKKAIKKIAMKAELEVEPMLHDRGLSPWLQNIVDENVGLIRSIPEEKETSFKNALVALITQDANVAEIAKVITKHIGTSGNVAARARLIARDQVGKMNARMNQYRQQQLGGSRYVWQGADDERERPDHNRLNGKTFRWDSPPIVDRATGRRAHPGGDYECRCRAKMVIEDLID